MSAATSSGTFNQAVEDVVRPGERLDLTTTAILAAHFARIAAPACSFGSAATPSPASSFVQSP